MIYAATGHRPQFLPCKFNESDPWLIDLKTRLLDWMQFNNPDKVISGMALGWDMWVADAALQLGIPFDAYVPFPGQPTRWADSSIKHYNYLLSKAAKVKTISKYYSNRAFTLRDEAMVNDATGVVALLSPKMKSGGTFYTVNYAKKNGKNIINFWYEGK